MGEGVKTFPPWGKIKGGINYNRKNHQAAKVKLISD
jgi:hypothetical protein